MIAMLAVGLAAAIPITLIVRSDGGTATRGAAVPALGKAVHDRALGVRYQRPEGWTESKRASAIRLTSRDRAARLVIASPAPAARSGEVLDEAVSAIRSGYREVEVVPGSGKSVGGRPAKGAVISARSKRGVPLRILVAVARGERRAHLVELFVVDRSSARKRIAEAQVALDSLRFTN